MAVLPRVAGDKRGRPELVAQLSRLTLIAAGVALLLLIALRRPIVSIFLSTDFLPALPLIWIIAPGMLLRAGSKILTPYFMGTGRPAICSWAVAIGMVINVGALLTLLPRIGLPGAAWAMSLGYVGSSLVLAVAFTKASGLSVGEIWMIRRSDLVTLGETLLRARGLLWRLNR